MVVRAADPNFNRNDPFQIEHLHQKIKSLLKHGARLDATDDLEQTPIHIATKYALVSTLPILLDATKNQPFDFNKRDNSGDTILMLAAEANEVDKANEMVPAILTAGLSKIKVNEKNCVNSTPLGFTVNRYQYTTAIALVRAGADPEIKVDLDTSGKIIKINVFELIEQQIQLHKEHNLNLFKEQIILERLIFLTEQSLKNYRNSRSGLFSITPGIVSVYS